MLLIALRKGGADGAPASEWRRCDATCPFYSDAPEVRGLGGKLRTHCRMTMQTWMADCDHFDVRCIETLTVSEEEWATMQAAVRKKARKKKWLYPEQHEVIHVVGCEWTRSKGRHNKNKSNSLLPQS